jgi:hypothetical protein
MTTMKPDNSNNPDRIKVKVKRGLISIDQEPVYVWDGAATITWDLQTPGYRFAADSISIQGDNGRVFTQASWDATTQVWNNANPDQVNFKYTINVISTSGKSNPPPLDPTIGNQGR